MRKFTVVLIALTLIIGGLVAQVNLKDRTGAAGRTPGENPNIKVTDRLTPTDEEKPLNEMLMLSSKQNTKIEEIKAELQKQMDVWTGQIQKLRTDKQKAMQNRDFEGAKKVTGQMFDLKKTMANARIDAIQAIFNELNADQKAVVKEYCGKDGRGIGALLGGRMCGDGQRLRRTSSATLQEKPQSGLKKASDLNKTKPEPSTVK